MTLGGGVGQQRTLRPTLAKTKIKECDYKVEFYSKTAIRSCSYRPTRRRIMAPTVMAATLVPSAHASCGPASSAIMETSATYRNTPAMPATGKQQIIYHVRGGGMKWASPESIQWFIDDQAFSPNDLAPSPPPPPLRSTCWQERGERRGGNGGAKSYEGEKAWPSINHSIFSGPAQRWPTEDESIVISPILSWRWSSKKSKPTRGKKVTHSVYPWQTNLFCRLVFCTPNPVGSGSSWFFITFFSNTIKWRNLNIKQEDLGFVFCFEWLSLP